MKRLDAVSDRILTKRRSIGQLDKCAGTGDLFPPSWHALLEAKEHALEVLTLPRPTTGCAYLPLHGGGGQGDASDMSVTVSGPGYGMEYLADM